MRKNKLSLLALTSITLSSLTVGKASYVIDKINNYSIGISNIESKTPVCYVKYNNSDSKTYYTSIEKALELTNNNTTSDTIVVIPNTNPTISSDVTLNASDRFVIPMDEDIINLRAYTSDDKGTSYINYISSSDVDCYTKIGTSSESNVIKSTLTIKEGITFTINGTLDIGGAIGYRALNSAGTSYGCSAQRPCSWTNNEATKMVLNKNSKIDVKSGGKLNCYGFIVQDSYNNGGKVILESGANAVEPFTIYDFGGAGDMLNNINYGTLLLSKLNNEYGEKTSPFNVYSFHNIGSIEFNTGSTLVGDCLVSTASGTNLELLPNSVTLISDTSGDGMFKFTSSALDFLVNNTSSKQFKLGSGLSSIVSYLPTTEIYINGGEASMNSINMEVDVTIKTVTIDTSGAMLSIPSNLNIYLQKTQFDLNQGFKMMPKAYFSIDSDSVMNINQQSISYTRYNNSSSSDDFYSLTYAYASDWKKVYPYSSTNTPTLINNGTLNLNASFAGNITTNTEGAKINVNTDTFSITTHEYHRVGLSGDSVTDMTVTESLRYNDKTKLNEKATYIYTNGAYVKDESNKLKSVSIDPSSGSSDAGSSKQYTLNAVLNPTTPDEIDDLVYTWTTSDSTNGYFGSTSGTSSATGSSVTFNTTDNGSTDSDAIVTVTLTVTSKTDTSLKFTATGTYTRTKSCIIEGTLITMADGTKKPVEFVASGDEVLVFNHETGRIETSKVVFNDHNEAEAKQYMIVWCEFSNGSRIGVVSEHGFFCFEENKYIYINETNYASYIGKHFITFDASGNKKIVELINSYIEKKICKVYSPVTKSTLNYFTEGMLSMPGGISGLFNIFEYDPTTLKYDESKKQADIGKYGLLSLEDFGGQIDQYVFDAFNGKYLGISTGKGMLTWERIEELIKRYAPLCK